MESLLAIFVSLFIFILALGLAFCWYQWKLIRAYRHIPSHRLDTKWLLKVMLRRNPEKVPFTNVFFQELIKICRKFRKEGLCVVWMGFRPHLLIYNDYFMKIFANEVAAADKPSMYDNIKDAFGESLLGSDAALWKVHRKLLNPMFNLGVLKGNMHIFNRNAEDLVQKFQSLDKPSEDMSDILKRCTFNVIQESVLGAKLNDEKFESKTENFMKMIDKGTEAAIYRVPRPWLQWKLLLPLFSAGRMYLDVINQVQRFTFEVIDELKKSVLASGKVETNLDSEVEVRKSLAQILIEQHVVDPVFSIENLRDHLFSFLAAGYDTVSYTMTWCLYLLGHHPEVQQEAFQEIESVVMGKDVKHEDLNELKYLDCVIKETLRLYSTVPIYGRKLSKELQCGQYRIPKGTDVLFCSFMLHRNPNVFPDPEKFQPERFATSSDIRPWMHIPFAEGYRNCIGKRFALMEMKVLLVHVLRRFEIKSLTKIEDRDLDWAIVLKTTKPLRMLFKTRRPQSGQIPQEIYEERSHQSLF